MVIQIVHYFRTQIYNINELEDIVTTTRTQDLTTSTKANKTTQPPK